MGCSRCHLAAFRTRQVPGRGDLPADFLFIGEAPGRTEDLLGKAFIGPTKRIIDAAQARVCQLLRLAAFPSSYFTNVLQCRPCDVLGGPNRQPTGEEAWACWPNLERQYLAAKPKRVVFLGKIPEQFCSKAWPSAARLQHPAYILRKGGVESPEFRIFARHLEELVKEHLTATRPMARRIG